MATLSVLKFNDPYGADSVRTSCPTRGPLALQSRLACPSNQRGALPGPFAYTPVLDHLEPILAPAEEQRS
jgi:hypothetical protein